MWTERPVHTRCVIGSNPIITAILFSEVSVIRNRIRAKAVRTKAEILGKVSVKKKMPPPIIIFMGV